MNIDRGNIEWHSYGVPKHPGLYVGDVDGYEQFVWYTGHRFIDFFTRKTITVSRWGSAKEKFEDIVLYNVDRFM